MRKRGLSGVTSLTMFHIVKALIVARPARVERGDLAVSVLQPQPKMRRRMRAVARQVLDLLLPLERDGQLRLVGHSPALQRGVGGR